MVQIDTNCVWCWLCAVTHDHPNLLVCPFACLFVHSCSISSRINRPTSQENRWSLWQSCYCYSQLQTMPACWSPQSSILRCLQPLVATPSATGGRVVLRPSIVRVGCVLIYENTIVWRYDTSTGLFSEDHIMNLHSLKWSFVGGFVCHSGGNASVIPFRRHPADGLIWWRIYIWNECKS